MTTEHATTRVTVPPLHPHIRSNAFLTAQAFLISKRQREITYRFKSQADRINYRKIAQADHVCCERCSAKANVVLSDNG